jgi:hypothetical protein
MRFSLLPRLALPAFVACSSSSQITASNLGPPATTGTISSKDVHLGYVVDRSPGTSGPAQLYFLVNASTNIQVNGTSGGSSADLTTGKTVSVWPAGALPDSAPPHVVARYVLIYR